jgi:hypothetical protein
LWLTGKRAGLAHVSLPRRQGGTKAVRAGVFLKMLMADHDAAHRSNADDGNA